MIDLVLQLFIAINAQVSICTLEVQIIVVQPN